MTLFKAYTRMIFFGSVQLVLFSYRPEFKRVKPEPLFVRGALRAAVAPAQPEQQYRPTSVAKSIPELAEQTLAEKRTMLMQFVNESQEFFLCCCDNNYRCTTELYGLQEWICSEN